VNGYQSEHARKRCGTPEALEANGLARVPVCGFTRVVLAATSVTHRRPADLLDGNRRQPAEAALWKAGAPEAGSTRSTERIS
jgi:hypothetical protein